MKPESKIQQIVEKMQNEFKLKKNDDKIDFDDFCYMYLMLKYEKISILDVKQYIFG